MIIAYLAIAIVVGLATAVWGWIAGLFMLTSLGFYTLGGSLGVFAGGLAVALKDGFRTLGVETAAYPAE
jgi:hypothetical protein